jgi:predicted site-specific integrase-resolvase
VPTTKQDLDRQIDALRKEGISAGQIYIDMKSGASTNRPGLHGVTSPTLGRG